MRVEVTMNNSREEKLSVEQTEDANPRSLLEARVRRHGCRYS